MEVLSEEAKAHLAQLINEKDQLTDFDLATDLLNKEIERIQSGKDVDKLIELHNDKPCKVTVKVKVPVKEYPKFNFVGKIIGPKGNSLKRLQEETGCRMAVLGKGSMRNKEKEEEMRKEGGKYAHLNEDLHVWIETFAHPVEAHRQVSMALAALRQYLVPDYNDMITMSQMEEMSYMNGDGRGGGAPRGRGMVRGRGMARGMPPRGMPPTRMAARGGHPASRGTATRGSRGTATSSVVRGAPAAGRGVQQTVRAPETYSYDTTTDYSYGMDYQESYETGYANPAGETESYDYSQMTTGMTAYPGYGDATWGREGTAPSAYGKIATPRSQAVATHPYAAPAARGTARY